MLIGRPQEFIAKMQRACAAWLRQDASLAVYARGHSLLKVILNIEADLGYTADIYDPMICEDHQLLSDCYDLIRSRDLDLRYRILQYLKANDPNAEARKKHQLTMFD